ncbi:hypothetical protein BC834DRAFT_843467 [Gloeopeniophorella convolvens]|nr:hypothetical protein BC834DRAFT_843467 [Gloeopeniophorella convolvens]
MPSQKQQTRTAREQELMWNAAFRPVGQLQSVYVDPSAIQKISGIPGGQGSSASSSTGQAQACSARRSSPRAQKQTSAPRLPSSKQRPSPPLRFLAPMTSDSSTHSGQGPPGGDPTNPMQMYTKPGRRSKTAPIPGSGFFPGVVIRR